MNVESAYREFRNESAKASSDPTRTLMRCTKWRGRAEWRWSADGENEEGVDNGRRAGAPAARRAVHRAAAVAAARARRSMRRLARPLTTLAADAPRRPNIVIILGDDLGFADMGSFGSEIKTPNLDALAKAGVRFTNFYTHASCSPTRSMLLSGVDTHLNGLGNMDEWTAPNQRGAVGYEGYLNTQVRHAAAAAQGCRLSHLHGRQVASGQGARPDPSRARLRARLLAARRRRQLLGHDELHRRVAAVGLHRGRALPDEAAQGLLRDQDLHRQADRIHRRQPWRRQAVLRLRGAPGAARSLSPAEGMAQSPRRRVRQGLGRGAAGAAEAADRARHHAGRHAARRADVVRARSRSCSRRRAGRSSARRWSSTPAWWRTSTTTSAGSSTTSRRSASTRTRSSSCSATTAPREPICSR